MPAPESDDPAYIAAALERRRIVYECLQALNEKQRKVLFLRYHMDMNYKQIGYYLGVSDSTAHAWHSLALDLLFGAMIRRRIFSSADLA